MYPVGPTLGVLDRNGRLVASLRGLSGTVRRKPGGGLTAVYSAELVGTPSYWCTPGVELRLTLLMNPKRKKSARLGTVVQIAALENGRISLSGSDYLHKDNVWTDPLPEVLA